MNKYYNNFFHYDIRQYNSCNKLYTTPPQVKTVELVKCVTDGPAGDELDGIPIQSCHRS